MNRITIICAAIAASSIVAGGIYFIQKINTRDTEPPVITLAEDTLTLSVEDPKARLLEGVTAYDEGDGDLTDSVLVNDIQLVGGETDAEKRFEISYVVFDSSNNMAYETRNLIYTDYRAPRFSITAPLRYSSVSSVDLYRNVNAEDCLEGDLSSQIMVSMDDAFLSATTYGNYTCTVEVTNSLGDSSVLPLEFEVYDSSSMLELTRPNISLTEYLTYISVGESFDPLTFLTDIQLENTTYALLDKESVPLTEDVTVHEYGYYSNLYGYFLYKDAVTVATNLDTRTPGVYTVDYSFTHPTEKTRGSAKLVVVVEP